MPLLYCTCKNAREAKRIAEKLLKEKLIACANIIPNISSLYLWKKKIRRSREALLLAKTSAPKMRKAMGRMKELHSYTVPVVYALECRTMNREALGWMKQEGI